MTNETSKPSLRSRIAERYRVDRGAVLVEAALCIPLLLLVILGAIEAGFGWEAKSSTTAGARSGVLRAATGGGAPDTDLRILQAVVGEVGAENVDRIEHVLVFDAGGASGDAATEFAACTAQAGAGNPTSGGPGCIAYNGAFVELVATTSNPTALLSSFDDGMDPAGNCTGGIDFNWCAASRTAGGSDSEVGVAVRYQHEWFTSIFPFGAPRFEEFVVTSTFANGGTDVNGGIPGAIPFVAGPFFDFQTAGNATSDPDIAISGPAPLSTLTTTAPAPGNSETYLRAASGEIELLLTNQPFPGTVCIDFDVLAIGSWDSSRDRFEARIEDSSNNVLSTNGEQFYNNSNTDQLGLGHGPTWVGSVSNSDTICASVPPNGTLRVVFDGDLQDNSGNPNTNLNDESFAIDNISVRRQS